MKERSYTDLDYETEKALVEQEGPNGAEKVAEETNDVTLEGQKLTAETAEKTAAAQAKATAAAAAKASAGTPPAKSNATK